VLWCLTVKWTAAAHGRVVVSRSATT